MPKKKPNISKKMRKEFALALAELAYDVFKVKNQADKVKSDQKSKNGA